MAKKILVADDDPSVVETLRAILERSQYEVDTASNGEECLKKVLMNKPDLLIMDVAMPKMDGYSFLVAIKELKALTGDAPEMPVLVISGRDDDITKGLVGKENIKDYILKPFDLKELLGKIKRVLGDSQTDI